MIARAVTSMNRMLRQVVSWQPLRSCPRTRGRVLRYCEICWCDWVGCQGIVGCFMFWCGGVGVSCGVECLVLGGGGEEGEIGSLPID